MANLVKEVQAEKKILCDKISEKKCDCEQLNQHSLQLRENEKKAAQEQISNLSDQI